ncbi:MAG: glycoside hydrolase family 3 C-terminal domain-containing protein [Coriobacteriia bacterium]|nr:glycoside hydrolase family 3 C-terminal domain-containing protein [Coriobacteriia bacterium]
MGEPVIPSAARAARAREIVAGLSLDGRIRLLSGADMWHTVAVPEADVPAIMLTDGPHGLRKQGGSGDVGFAPGTPATCFPTSATLACSWDPALAEEVGRAIGEEAAAAGVAVVLGPGLNLKRHPCCGRNFEYYAEDPLLSGRMAAGLVRGMQSTGVGACLKHYAANNQETNRMVLDAVVDERTLRELYLAGFETAIVESAPWTVMCAYNRVNGEYCSDSRRLLTGILREEWGFQGLVMSDWGAVNDRAAAVAAGLDLEMPGSHGANNAALREAVRSGVLAEEAVDACAARVVELALRSQGTAGARAEDGLAAYDADAHHELARRAAAESTVLLTNDGILPLVRGARVAVIGAMAAEPRYQGSGSSQVTPTRLDSALDALRNTSTADDGAPSGADVTYVSAYDPVTGELEQSGLAEATRAAADAEVALVFVGLPPRYESEGFDREHLRLPEGHDRLVEAVCASNPRTVVVLAGGAPVELPWAEAPAATVVAYLGGQAGGGAVADVLLGDAEPGGRLAETWPLALEDVAADANFPGEGRQVRYREGLYVGYRYFTTTERPVRSCFGHGLSYTTFEYGAVSVSAARIDAGDSVTVSVPVTNTGARRGATVVQVYVRDVSSAVHRPVRELRGFRKLWLDAGETAEASITLGPRAFAFYDVVSEAWQIEGGEFEVLVGASVDDIRARATVRVESQFRPASLPAPPGLVADDVRFAAMLGTELPAPEPTAPYSRTSTVGDLDQTALGRRVQRVLLSALRRRLAGAVEADPASAAMMERVVMEMPLRNLVTMSEGRLGWRTLDVLVDALNGRWGQLLRRLLRG